MWKILFSLQLLALALVVTAVTGQPKAMAKPSGYLSHGHTYGTRSADSESGMITCTILIIQSSNSFTILPIKLTVSPFELKDQ